jgi:hypothetical protein
MVQIAETGRTASATRSSGATGVSLSRRFVRGLAVFIMVWTVLWSALGIWTRHEVETLSRLGSTVVESGTAVKQTGDALQGLRALPFVGGDVANIGKRVSRAGIDARRSGRESRAAVGHLATLLGLAVALVPIVPMIALYLVARRLARRRGQT